MYTETMNTETKKLVMNFLVKKYTGFLEGTSTNEFLQMVGDKIHEETGEEYSDDVIKGVVGEMVLPLYYKLGEWLVENMKYINK